ncbi:unnamed protein product [Timema podura]|uniref:Uncharacterized protein n=1 Tax=Timema podura TaxID=61482 RepID=A0ABN7NMS2_TIMPD|nr:unnamed protein product [Timema podura]
MQRHLLYHCANQCAEAPLSTTEIVSRRNASASRWRARLASRSLNAATSSAQAQAYVRTKASMESDMFENLRKNLSFLRFETEEQDEDAADDDTESRSPTELLDHKWKFTPTRSHIETPPWTTQEDEDKERELHRLLYFQSTDEGQALLGNCEVLGQFDSDMGVLSLPCEFCDELVTVADLLDHEMRCYKMYLAQR